MEVPVYFATKYSVRVISEALRQEVKLYNIRTSVVSPKAVDIDLPDSVTAPDIAEGICQYYAQNAIPFDSFARAVAFISSQPENVDVNEVLFRTTVQQL